MDEEEECRAGLFAHCDAATSESSRGTGLLVAFIETSHIYIRYLTLCDYHTLLNITAKSEKACCDETFYDSLNAHFQRITRYMRTI